MTCGWGRVLPVTLASAYIGVLPQDFRNNDELKSLIHKVCGKDGVDRLDLDEWVIKNKRKQIAK